MRNPALKLRQSDTAVPRNLKLIEQGYLAAVALITLATISGRFVPQLAHLTPRDWVPVNPQIALAALMSALGLELSRSSRSRFTQGLGTFLGGLVVLVAAAVLFADMFRVAIRLDVLLGNGTGAPNSGRMPALPAAAFAALGWDIVLIRARRGIASHAADLLVSAYCILVLSIVSGYMFEGLTTSADVERTSILTLLILALLAFAAFLRRAEAGIFAAFLGRGSGSRMARMVAPLVLLIPFLPQSALVHAIRSGAIRAEYLSAVAALATAGICVGVILYMALKIDRLEKKVRDLTLRDELTGLYNRRGFHLVAWQALRQARRSGMPFSVMFIGMDDLSKIRDERGDRTEQEALVEMAEILKAAFRDTDVIGRIDPDQFALAGHFGAKASAVMRLRLQEAVNYRNSHPGRSFLIAVSIGCVNSKDPRHDSLEEMLAQADEARDQELESAGTVVSPGPPTSV